MPYKTSITILLIFICHLPCKGQNKFMLSKGNLQPESKEIIIADCPNHITRTIKEDRNGDIYMAAFDGVSRYDGKTFINLTKEISSARFFSTFEDKEGNMWFGSIGSGVFRYDGESFQNYTIEDGLLNNEIVSIFQDKAGDIWFGANGGVSRYDGRSFRNYLIDKKSMKEDKTGKSVPSLHRPMNEVNAMIEDKIGKIWFATRGFTFVYDGIAFAPLYHNDRQFTNVRTLIEDKAGNIWLGGNDGLWRYDGTTFTQITEDFVGYIYEDQLGNIWTSSQSMQDRKWILSRYNQETLNTINPTVTEIRSQYEDNSGMIFGIEEASNGDIWFGSLRGISFYDGDCITVFRNIDADE